MAGLYLNEITDPALLALPKHAIGDRVKIVQIKGDLASYPEDTQQACAAVLGRVLQIKDIVFWQTLDPENPYYVTYEFYIAHLTGSPNRLSYLESFYLDDDEIKATKKRARLDHPGDPSSSVSP